MKKFKRIIPFMLALIMALAIPLAACDSCGGGSNDEKNDAKVLQSVSVDTAGAKTIFAQGKEFTSEGLVVVATFVDSKSQESKETLSDTDYQLDSSAYNKDELGVYSIKVSYTYKEVTKDTSYQVEVVVNQDGLDVALAEGVEDTYTLSAGQKTVEIDTAKIVVKPLNKDGSIGDAISNYTVKLYKGEEEIALTDGKASVGGGAYAIWAEKESDRFPGYILRGFAVIYVNDNLESITKKEGVGSYSQPEGVDLISGTWVFTANYASGNTKEIKSMDCTVGTVNTLSTGSKTTKVSYTDYNAKGEKFVKELEVQYSVTAFNGTKVNNTFKYSEITGKSDKGAITQDDLNTASNSFLTLGSGEVTWRNNNTIEIVNDGLQVTINGTGSITIGFSSTGSTNVSRVGLKDADGNYVPATSYDKNNANISLDDSEDDSGNLYENVYLVKNTNSCEFTYVITKPGTYTIASEKNNAYPRGCRIHKIAVIDYIPETAGASLASVDYSNQTYITYKKVEQV